LKFEYSEDEKRAILEQHNLFKKSLQSKVKRLMINEQVEDGTGAALSGKDLLTAALSKNCKIAVGGELQSENGDPSKPYIIYKKADYNSANGYFKTGDELYIKDDFTFDVVSTDASGAKKMTTGLQWGCKALTAEAEAAKKAADDAAAKAKEDADKAAAQAKQDADDASKLNVDRTKQEGNWKERKDIVDTDANVENPQMYEKKVVNGVTLYRRKASSSITSGLTQDQKSIIESWQDKGYKLRTDLSPEEAKTWKEVVVSPATEGYFSQDLKMFFDPTTLTKGVGTGDTKVSVTKVIQDAVANRVPTDKKDCKQTIEAYYISWKKKRPLQPNEFDALKTKTQACKNEFGGDWGALFPGGNKADEILDILSGVKAGGPSSYGNDAKWRIQ
jgi:hypothetical protein